MIKLVTLRQHGNTMIISIQLMVIKLVLKLQSHMTVKANKKIKFNATKEATPSKDSNKEDCNMQKPGPSKRISEIEAMSDRVEAQNDKLLSVMKKQHKQKMRKIDRFLQIFEKSVERSNKSHAVGE